ncbi:hypothetical protein LX64_01311 [Chitinophaga skermanii]|uniref:Lipoprotein n=1 Tax=Chitinophaga skermanii TaxID=331697 RepID=A0A327R449_9BACT|nr:hypothetical protein [Chitinophaga skermanii]RAJ08657.1 hypothetical protein LX64_01311 [Chitinophaga skermanii]
MKTMLKLLGVLLLTSFIFAACSKDDDPADTDIFAGTFKGKISYTAGGETTNADDGSIFVTKVGRRYDFRFSNGIPDLTGVEFEQKDDNTMVNIGASGTGLITINKDKLVIGFTRDGKTWTADCTR